MDRILNALLCGEERLLFLEGESRVLLKLGRVLRADVLCEVFLAKGAMKNFVLAVRLRFRNSLSSAALTRPNRLQDKQATHVTTVWSIPLGSDCVISRPNSSRCFV
jgi:hypothetical protein